VERVIDSRGFQAAFDLCDASIELCLGEAEQQEARQTEDRGV